jgi:hypothetical protein
LLKAPPLRFGLEKTQYRKGYKKKTDTWVQKKKQAPGVMETANMKLPRWSFESAINFKWFGNWTDLGQLSLKK